MQDDTHDVTSAAIAPPQQAVDSGGDFDWTEPYPTVEESAPGDALYETLEDFVFDQSEGEDSDDDRDAGKKQEEGEDGDSGSKQLGLTKQSSSTAQPGPSTQLRSIRKATYARFTEEQKLVVYLLKQHHALSAKSFTTAFNQVFRGEGVNRTVDSLEKWWSRNKDDWKNKFVDPSQDELAEHNKWEEKVKDALKALQID